MIFLSSFTRTQEEWSRRKSAIARTHSLPQARDETCALPRFATAPYSSFAVRCAELVSLSCAFTFWICAACSHGCDQIRDCGLQLFHLALFVRERAMLFKELVKQH